MRLSAFLPALLLPLCACVSLETPVQPESLRLSTSELRLRLTDGTICRTDWRAAPSGRLEGCGPGGYGYAVQVDPYRNLARQLAEGIVMALGAEAALAPMAEVVITDPSGTDWVFTSPAPFEE